MKTRLAMVFVLFLPACGGFLAGRLAGPTPSAAAAPSSEEGYQYQFLQVGKTYSFHWRNTDRTGTLAEVPRAGWVKIKAPAAGADAQAVWVNLATVEWIGEEGKEK